MDIPVGGQTELPGRIAGMASAAVWAGYVSNRQQAAVAGLAAPQEGRRAILESDAAGDSEGHGLRYDQFERRQPEPKQAGEYPMDLESLCEASPGITTGGTTSHSDAILDHVLNRVDYQA